MGDEEKAALASHSHTPTPTQSRHTSSWKPPKAGLGEGVERVVVPAFVSASFSPGEPFPVDA